MTFVVVRHGAVTARLHRQSRLGAVERWMTLFPDREHHRMGGRISVETDNVLGTLPIVRQSKRSNTIWCERVSLKDALHRPQAYADRFRQYPSRPMGGCSRRRTERQIPHRLHRGCGQQRLAGFAGLVPRQPLNAFSQEPRLPAPDPRLGLAGSPHDLARATAISRRKDDLGAPNMLLRGVSIADDRLKATAIC